MEGMTTRPPDIIATANAHDVAYWDGHPQVMLAELRPIGAKSAPPSRQLLLWLTEAPGEKPKGGLVDRFGLKLPERQPDIELGGEGEPIVDFIARCPSLVHAEMFREGSDAVYPRGWWAARLWIAPSGAAGREL